MVGSFGCPQNCPISQQLKKIPAVQIPIFLFFLVVSTGPTGYLELKKKPFCLVTIHFKGFYRTTKLFFLRGVTDHTEEILVVGEGGREEGFDKEVIRSVGIDFCFCSSSTSMWEMGGRERERRKMIDAEEEERMKREAERKMLMDAIQQNLDA